MLYFFYICYILGWQLSDCGFCQYAVLTNILYLCIYRIHVTAAINAIITIGYDDKGQMKRER